MTAVAKKETADQKVVAEAPKAKAPSASPSRKYIKHSPVELFSARVITAAQWAEAGIHGQDTVEWNEVNDFQLPVEMFTEAAIRVLLKNNPGFQIVG